MKKVFLDDALKQRRTGVATMVWLTLTQRAITKAVEQGKLDDIRQ